MRKHLEKRPAYALGAANRKERKLAVTISWFVIDLWLFRGASASAAKTKHRHQCRLGRVEKRRSDVSLPVAIGQIFTWPPQSGLAWFCFLFPLIELDRRVSRIQLSEKGSRGCPRKAGGSFR